MQATGLQELRREAEEFCAANLQECCTELIEWQNTALLRDGKVRALDKLCRKYVGGNDGLRVAERMVQIQACERLSKPSEQSPQAPCGESIDTPEFRELISRILDKYWESGPHVAALITYIDAKLVEARRVTEGWIDLKDQKPKDWQRVLVALNTGTVCEGYRGSVGWNWAETDHPDDAEATATHWKPWPKHPGAAAPALGKERSKHADQA